MGLFHLNANLKPAILRIRGVTDLVDCLEFCVKIIICITKFIIFNEQFMFHTKFINLNQNRYPTVVAIIRREDGVDVVRSREGLVVRYCNIQYLNAKFIIFNQNKSSPASNLSLIFMHGPLTPAEFIIFTTILLVNNTQSLVFDTQFLV